MRIYILPKVEHVSRSYHSGGGLVIVASDAAEAQALCAADKNIQVTDAEWTAAVVYELMDNEPARLFVFPNAGCC